MKTVYRLTILPLALFVLSLPQVLYAQGFVPCGNGAPGDPGYTPCNGCHLVDLASNVLNWLFGFVFVLFGVIVFVAGFGLVTSGGNQAQLDAAKKKLSNAVIGIIIVFVAWLAIDTLMRALIPGGNTSLGPWNEITCDFAPNAVNANQNQSQANAANSGGWTAWSATGATVPVTYGSGRNRRTVNEPVESRSQLGDPSVEESRYCAERNPPRTLASGCARYASP